MWWVWASKYNWCNKNKVSLLKQLKLFCKHKCWQIEISFIFMKMERYWKKLLTFSHLYLQFDSPISRPPVLNVLWARPLSNIEHDVITHFTLRKKDLVQHWWLTKIYNSYLLSRMFWFQAISKIIGCFWDHWSRRRLMSQKLKL